VVVLALLVGAARLFRFESWTIPEDRGALTASIAPTLRGGDTVLMLMRGTPDRGALVRCKDPEEPSRWVIGRIVGLQGETVTMSGPNVVVDGQRFDVTEECKERTFTVAHPDSGAEIEVNCQRVDFAGSWHFRGAMAKPPAGEPSAHKVGPGMVFLLSDNRDVHDDSRDFGTIPLDSCQGNITYRLWGRDGWSDSAARMTYIR
jgi:signal peptidase I